MDSNLSKMSESSQGTSEIESDDVDKILRKFVPNLGMPLTESKKVSKTISK